jgi:hypothetical protein
MKRKLDKNFSYTLDGYMEAKEYLQRKGRGTDFNQNKLTGMELVGEANKLIKEEQRSTNIFYSVKSYSINAIKFLRKKMTYRIHTISGIICLAFL